MSIFNPKKKNKNEEALNNHKIDIYNPISDDFKNNHNIKTNSHIEITTERKKLDVKKESQNTEINNTSVDLNSNYGGENIEIKNLYNFKSHLSELKYIMNSKADTTISKEIKNSEKGDNKKDLNNNIDINIDEDDKNIKAINIPEEPITSKNLYVIYNLTANGSISEKDLIKKVNSLKNKDDEIISTKGVEYMQPRIKFNNGIRPHESFFFSQRLMLSFLWEQYKNYIIDFDENKLKAKINLDACLNILLFMRNSKRFSNDDDVTDTVKNIFYIFLNQIESKAV